MATVLALPTKQARAQRTRDRLLEAGSALLRHGSLDDVSIAQIAGKAGCSVGVFYFRFKDKDAFFRFLLDETFEKIKASTQAQFANPQELSTKPAETISACVEHFIALMREHQGLIRAAQRQTIHNSDSWQPVRAMGWWLVDQYVGAIAAAHVRSDDSRFQDNCRTALQIVSGVLVNAVLNRPALLSLDSKDLPFWMNQVVSQCLQVQDAPQLQSRSKSTNNRIKGERQA